MKKLEKVLDEDVWGPPPSLHTPYPGSDSDSAPGVGVPFY